MEQPRITRLKSYQNSIYCKIIPPQQWRTQAFSLLPKLMKMATEPQQQFETAENKLLSALNPAAALTNQTEMAVMAAKYLIETAFRFIKLGSRIKQEIKKNRLELDTAVKSEGIFRTPVHIGLNNTMFDDFYFNGRGKLLYPDAYKALEPEIQKFKEGSEEEKKEAEKVLKVAAMVIPDIAEDNEFTDPMLTEIVGKWIDPGQKNIREIVMDLTPLLTPEKLSMDGLKDTLEQYAFQKLKFYNTRLDKLSLQQLNTVNESIQDLVWGALSGEDTSVEETLDFLVDRRQLQIDQEIEALRAEQEKLDSGDPDLLAGTPPELLEKERKQILTRIEELEILKDKLREVDTSA